MNQTITNLTEDQIARGRRFVEELRKNPNKAIGVMKTKSGRCCLCVAYETAQCDGANLSSHNGLLPPKEMAEWYGWERVDPLLKYEDEDGNMVEALASDLNDGYHAPNLTHAEIATAFEDTFPQLKTG